MDSVENYKLRAKNFWRKNKKLISLVVLAALTGVFLAAANVLYYNYSTQKFVLENPQTISNSESASFTFNLSNPELATNTRVDLTIEGTNSRNPAQVSINGEHIREITQREIILKLQTDNLQEKNTVRIYRRGPAFSTQKLVDASVESYTNLQQLMFVVLNLASIALIFTPFGYVKYQQYTERKKIEDKFPQFLRDIVQGTRAGMSLPQAIQNAESGNYGPLDKKIKKMSSQLEWGIPFEEVLENFSKEVGSPLISRSVDTIIQAYNSGGNVQDVLESVGENIRSIKQLNEERQSQLYGEMITGYIVYFIFIGILVALTTFLLPNLATASQSLGGSLNVLGTGGGAGLQENINLYESWFKRLVYIQALFSGLIIGKLSEGDFKAGIKHSAILFASGYLAITFFL